LYLERWTGSWRRACGIHVLEGVGCRSRRLGGGRWGGYVSFEQWHSREKGSEHGAPGLTLREKRDLHVAQTKLTREQMAFVTEIPADMRLQCHDVLDVHSESISIGLSVAILGV
jgi:hypothetical protein